MLSAHTFLFQQKDILHIFLSRTIRENIQRNVDWMCFLLQNNKYRYKSILSIGHAVDILYNDREIAKYQIGSFVSINSSNSLYLVNLMPRI